MIYPKLKAPKLSESVILTFGGIDKTSACPESCLSDGQNLSSRSFPLLTTRQPRLTLARLSAPPTALHTSGGITLTAGKKLFFNGVLQFDGLEEGGKKQIVTMGARALVFPDGYYINTVTADGSGVCSDRGYFYPYAKLSDGFIGLFPCVLDQPMPETGGTPPDEPFNGDYWLDTSVSPNKLMRYSDESGDWAEVTPTHTCLFLFMDSPPAVGGPLAVSGTGTPADGEHTVCAVKSNYIVIDGAIPDYKIIYPKPSSPVTVSQPMPKMDMVCEQGNRIWGCRCGTDRLGNFVNEIYASALGEPGSFYRYEGLSTDSYALSIGSEGEFTGIVSHMGYVVFFKERTVHRIFGTKPANFTLYEDAFAGVKSGCFGSLRVKDGVVYYLGCDGFYAYTGSSPVRISDPLGNVSLTDADAAFCRAVYTVAADGPDGRRAVYTYDTVRGIWHFEGYASLNLLAEVDSNAIALMDNLADYSLCLLNPDEVPPSVKAVYGEGLEREGAFTWFAESPYLTANTLDAKLLRRIQLRLEPKPASRVTVLCKTDGNTQWEEWATIAGGELTAHTIHLALPRCDRVKLRLEGVGECTLHGLTKTFEYGGEVV